MGFTKEDTKVIKGVAVLLMLAHHLLLFPNRMPTGYELISMFSIGGQTIEGIIGSFGKICVSLFMFLGGYGLYCRSRTDEKGKRTVSIGQQILSLYFSLWKVMAIFLPIGFLFFGNQELYSSFGAQCVNFSNFTIREFVGNITGWELTYNGEWWFFSSYIYALFLGCVFLEMTGNRCSKHADMFLVIVVELFAVCIAPNLVQVPALSGLSGSMFFWRLICLNAYIVCFLMGIVAAKYDSITQVRKMLNGFGSVQKILLSIVLQILVILIRVYFCDSGEIDLVLLPAYIASLMVLVDAIPYSRKVLLFFGKHSTNMWLTHSFFCFYFGVFAKAVYFTRNGVAAYMTLLALTMAASIFLDWFWKQVSKCFILLFGAKV